MANEKFKINGVVSEVVPVVGTTGDILKKTASGVKWESLVKATTTTNGLMSSADKTKLDGIETGAQKNTVTSVAGKTGAVTITKSDLGLGSVENIGIKILTQSQYDALSSTEKNRVDRLYGTYKE